MTKRIMAFLLATVMILSLLPVSAFADEIAQEETYIETSDNAVSDEALSDNGSENSQETSIPELEAGNEEPKEEQPTADIEEHETVTLTQILMNEITVEAIDAPAGAVLRVDVPDFDAYDAAIRAVAGEDYIEAMALDISVKNADGSALAEEVEITVSCDNFHDLPNGCTLYHVKDGAAQSVPYTLDKGAGTIAFWSKEFSPFLLIDSNDGSLLSADKRSLPKKSGYEFEFGPDQLPYGPTHFASGKTGYAISHIDVDADFRIPVAVNGKVYSFDPYLETTDAQYVSYSGYYADGTPAEARLTSVGTSEDVEMQIRLGIDGTNGDNFLEAGTKDDPVYWTITFSKTYTVYVDDDHLSTEWFEGCIEREVPFSFTATASYWSDNNECPGGPWWDGEYFEDMEIPYNFSGIDLKLGNNYGSLTIRKDVDGCPLLEDKTLIFDVFYVDPDTGERLLYTDDVKVTIKAGETQSETTLVQVPFGTFCIVEDSVAAQIAGYIVTIQYENESIVINDQTRAAVGAVKNSYTPAETSITLRGHKTFNNFPEDSKIKPVFTFTLSENGKVIDTKTVEKEGDFAFDSLTYTEAGTHTYTVVETKGNQAGVIYDTKTYTVTVKVQDKSGGVLVATIGGINADGSGLNFTNGYEAKPVDVQFSGMKTLSGRSLADKEFSFTLSGNGTTETVKNAADGKITFSKLSFTKAGTYTYTVKEEATNKAGVTIDSKIYNITVTVTDDGSGQLKAAISGDTTTGTDLNFKNTYAPGSTSVTLSGHKTFNNFPADSEIQPVFTFTLSENGTVIDTKTVTKQGDYAFDSLTYTEAGTHTYTVVETKGNQSGVIYDTKSYTVKVTVTDNKNGSLVATVTGINADGSGLNFTNGYEAKPVDVQFSGMKTLSGRSLADKEFSFTLSGNGTTETVKNAADGKITFSKLSFTKAGTYTYTVKEEATDEAGVTVDSKIYNITVTVTDSGDGQLKAAISGDTTTGTDLNFKNTYAPGSTSVTLSGHKTFNNFPADSEIQPVFTFTLSENGTVIDTKTVTKQGDFAFDSLTYTEAGTHTYTVVETKGTQSGVIYDTKSYTVKVTVTDNKNGSLVATVTGINADGSGLNFTNGYEAKPVDVQFSGMKTLSGRTLADKEFSFTLSGNGTTETVKNDADGKITFSKLTFTEAGTYTYTVKEEATDEAGVTVDSKIYNITVTVTDSGDGQLKAAISGDTTTGTDLNFKNTYAPGSTSVTLSGHKTFNNFPADSEIQPVFTFTLSENGTVIDTKTVTKQGDYAFDSLTYTEAGTHTYTVVETKGNQSGVIYDTKSYTVKVTVTDNKNGSLVATITGINADGSGLNFTNGYEAKPVDVQFSGMKTLSGRTLADKEFSFTLSGNGTTETVKNDADGKITFSKLSFTKAGTYTYTVKEEATNEAGVTVDSKIYNITVTVTDSGDGQLKAAISGDTTTGTDLNFKNTYAPGSTSVTLSGHKTFNNFPADSEIQPVFTFTLSENGTVIDTKTVTKQGDFAFDSITYTEEGIHTYTVVETKGTQSGVIYDTKSYTVKVTVTDNKNGSLVATVTGINADGSGLNFTNGYEAKPVDVQFSGMKTLSGRSLADKEFSFTLSGNGTTETVKNAADGKITFSKLSFTKAGTYTYTVKEEATNEAGVTVDSKIYNITVTVTDSGDGQLKAAISGDTQTGTDLNFKNTYAPGSTSVTLSGHKTFNNFPADSEIQPVFTFTLSENGTVIDTKSVTKQGDFAFDSITYTEEGIHTYTVVETKGTQSGVIYDTKSYTVKVTITDNKNGSLVATVTGINADGSGLNFTNGYEAKPVDVQFSGMKTLSGRSLADKEFSFTLSGNGTTETVKNDADGKITFSKLTFTEAGTYTYTVKEEATDEAGVTVDSKIYNITVTVTDSGDGQLKAAISGDTQTGTDLNFKNTYAPGSTSVTLSGHKTFNNFPADSEIEPVFTFTLSEDGTVIDTKTVTMQGDYAFDSITYTEEGTHTYTVVETEGTQSGVIYDTTTYEVTVTVTDNKQGSLVAVISGDSTTGTDLDFTNDYQAAPVDVQFSGMKTLEGRDLAVDEFSFTLTGEDGTTETVKNAADGNITFSELTFTEAGTYTYTVKEEATDEAGVTIDSKIYNITVTVTDSGDGQLKAAISGDTTTGTDLNFKNTYVPGSTYVTLSGHKTFNNFPADSEIEPVFTFTLSEDGTVIDTKTVTMQGDYAFDSITYTEEGTHTYTVVETEGTQSGVIYDTTTYEVTVTVTDNKQGSLVAVISGDSTTGTDLDFTNDYQAAPVDVQFSGMKTLEGRDLAVDEFSFTLTGEDGTTETVKNAADGNITFSELTFTEVGEYTYTVKEEATDEAGVTIDSKIYNITVTVTDSGDGQLKAAISGDTLTGTDLDFVNTFNSGSLTISKTVTGDLGDKNKEFTFTVTFDIDGTYSYTGSKTGTISSGESVKLKHGESITITGIPAGAKYTVVESDNSGYTVYKTGDVGTIVADTTASASFTNTRSSVPKTGDTRNLTMWLALALVSLIGGMGAVVSDKKKRRCYER